MGSDFATTSEMTKAAPLITEDRAAKGMARMGAENTARPRFKSTRGRRTEKKTKRTPLIKILKLSEGGFYLMLPGKKRGEDVAEQGKQAKE